MPPTLAAIAAAGAALFALVLGGRFNGRLPMDIDEDSLVGLFGIFASGMLSVATFTVSAIVSAAGAVAAGTTPKAARYAIEDAKGQFVLSSFISAFIYSIIGILALKSFHYGALGRFMLFLGLIVIVVIVLVAFIQWIHHVRLLGRQSHTLRRISREARASLNPEIVGTFGARPWNGSVPEKVTPVYPDRVGFVTEVRVAELQAMAEAWDAEIIVTTRPGALADPTLPLLLIAAAGDIRSAECARAVVLDHIRDDEHDFRINLLMLAETADRALSPGINDPGTAITILPLMLDLLLEWAKVDEMVSRQPPLYSRVQMPPLDAADLVDDCFTPIARDGAGAIEVNIRLQKTLASLKRSGHAGLSSAAERMSARAAELAAAALVSSEEKRIADRARAATASVT